MAKDFADINRLEHVAGIQAPEAGGKQELTNKFVKAWENQTTRRAVKGGVGMTMALTLAACGSDSDDELTATEAELAAAEEALTTLQASATATEAELAAAEEALTTLQSSATATEAELAAAEEALTTLQASATATEAELAAAEEAVATLTEERDGALAEIAEAAETTALSDLLTLSDASEAVDLTGLGDDIVVTVSGLTPYADEQEATITADGSGTMTFSFVDSDDTLTLSAASDISGFEAINIVGGTVDLTAVDLAGIASITVSSGVVLTAAQFLALENGVTGGSDDSEVTIIASTQEEVEQIIEAFEGFGGTLDAAAVTIEAAEGADEDLDVEKANADLDAAIVGAGVDGALPAALQGLADAKAAVADKQDEIEAYLQAAFENEFVAEAAENRGGSVSGKIEADDVIDVDIAQANDAAANAMIEASALPTDGDSEFPIQSNGPEINDSLEPMNFSTPQIDGEGVAFNDLTDAQQTSRIQDARAGFQEAINVAKTDVAAAEEGLEAGVTGLVDAIFAQLKVAPELYEAYEEAAQTFAEETAAAEAALGVANDSLPQGIGFRYVATDVEDPYTGDFIVTGTGASKGEEPVVATVADGVVTLSDDVTLEDGYYNYALGEDTILISQDVLEDYIAAGEALLAAAEDISDLQATATKNVNDLLNAQNPDEDPDYDFSAEEIIGVFAGESVSANDFGLIIPETLNLDNLGTYVATVQNLPEAFDPLVAYVDALQEVNENEAALAEFNDAVAAWQATDALEDGYNALVAEKTALETAATEAQEAITDESPDGLGIDIIDVETLGEAVFDEVGTATEIYVYSQSDASAGPLDAAITVSNFGTDGSDRLYMGAGTYSLVELGEEEDMSDRVGSETALEIFAKQDGDNVSLFVEGIASAGNGTTPADNNGDIVEIVIEDVTLADLSFDADSGILTAVSAPIA